MGGGKPTLTLLLLGGTADARQLATSLHEQGVAVQYSIVGTVRQPDVPCEVICGGFSRYGGLAAYIAEHQISAVLDATHPYARIISATAVDATKQNHIPCVRFLRPGWKQQRGDRWMRCGNWGEILQKLHGYQRPFFTTGQLSQEVLACLKSDQVALVRTAAAHQVPLSANCFWIKAIGPFSLKKESCIMTNHKIDVLVTKNAGGDATIAKLQAARQLDIPVLMLDRPHLKLADFEFFNPESCVKYCAEISD